MQLLATLVPNSSSNNTSSKSGEIRRKVCFVFLKSMMQSKSRAVSFVELCLWSQIPFSFQATESSIQRMVMEKPPEEVTVWVFIYDVVDDVEFDF